MLLLGLPLVAEAADQAGDWAWNVDVTLIGQEHGNFIRSGRTVRIGLIRNHDCHKNQMKTQAKEWLIAGTIVAAAMAFPMWLGATINHSHRELHDSDAEEAALPITAAENQHALQLVSSICSACHGEHLEGKIGPSLQHVNERYSLGQIEKIIRFGKGKKKDIFMPAGLVSDEDAALLARWLVLNEGNVDSSHPGAGL